MYAYGNRSLRFLQHPNNLDAIINNLGVIETLNAYSPELVEIGIRCIFECFRVKLRPSDSREHSWLCVTLDSLGTKCTVGGATSF
jgi:hypothetical protein